MLKEEMIPHGFSCQKISSKNFYFRILMSLNNVMITKEKLLKYFKPYFKLQWRFPFGIAQKSTFYVFLKVKFYTNLSELLKYFYI